MKTDRELLELAAKAAGIDWFDEPALLAGKGLHMKSGPFWNPLTDDGDAFRLAMRLGFTVEPGRCCHSHYGPVFGEDVLNGDIKSTRRAIVRAAAAIGEAMQ